MRISTMMKCANLGDDARHHGDDKLQLPTDLHSRTQGQNVTPFPKAKLLLAALKIDAVLRTTKHVGHAIYRLCTIRSVGSGTRLGKTSDEA